MSLTETIERDVIAAMKARDSGKVSALRMAKAAFMQYAIEKKKDKLEDADAVEVLKKQVKQRKESLESFEKASRADLAEKERKELQILQAYLPKELTDEEIKALVKPVIQASGAKTKADIGRVMKDAMPLLKGKADGKRVNEIILQLLT